MGERERQRLDKILTAITNDSRETFGDKLEAVILYGSYARGDYDEDSDIDVMVLVNMDREALLNYERGFSRLASRLSLADDDCTTISLLLNSWPHVEKWLPHIPFYQNVMRAGDVYKRQHFCRIFIDNSRFFYQKSSTVSHLAINANFIPENFYSSSCRAY